MNDYSLLKLTGYLNRFQTVAVVIQSHYDVYDTHSMAVNLYFQVHPLLRGR